VNGPFKRPARRMESRRSLNVLQVRVGELQAVVVSGENWWSEKVKEEAERNGIKRRNRRTRSVTCVMHFYSEWSEVNFNRHCYLVSL
jgi:hypothetical protein